MLACLVAAALMVVATALYWAASALEFMAEKVAGLAAWLAPDPDPDDPA